MEPIEGNSVNPKAYKTGQSLKREREKLEPLYKGRALPFIGQGEGRMFMWDKSHDRWDALPRGYCRSVP